MTENLCRKSDLKKRILSLLCIQNETLSYYII